MSSNSSRALVRKLWDSDDYVCLRCNSFKNRDPKVAEDHAKGCDVLTGNEERAQAINQRLRQKLARRVAAVTPPPAPAAVTPPASSAVAPPAPEAVAPPGSEAVASPVAP